jgi:hypothetical protein
MRREENEEFNIQRNNKETQREERDRHTERDKEEEERHS